jgi:hypothetical protein
VGILVVFGFSKKTVINRYLLLWPSVSKRAVDSLLTALPDYLHIRKLKYTSFARDVVIVVFDITVYDSKNVKERVTLINKLKFTQYKKGLGIRIRITLVKLPQYLYMDVTAMATLHIVGVRGKVKGQVKR